MSRLSFWLFLCLSFACGSADEEKGDSGFANGDDVGVDGDDTDDTDDTDTDTDDTDDDSQAQSTSRRVLHEFFTGSTCGPCAPADEQVSAVLEGDEGFYTMVKYPVGSDPYMTAESVSRIMGYLPGESSYGIPYVHADGVNGFHPNEMNDGEGYLQADFDGFAASASPMLLDVSHTVDGQTVDITIDYTVLADIESDNLVLHVAITEKETSLNVGTNGQTSFHDLMKKMVPDHNGTSLDTLRRADTDTLTLSYTFNGVYDAETGRTDMVDHATAHTIEEFEDLEVVVWVQDVETWEVFQSDWTRD